MRLEFMAFSRYH